MASITLLDLNLMVKNQLRKEFAGTFWIQAELSECKEHYSGHCYLELIQKRIGSDSICAKARATIWAKEWGELKPYFEKQTGVRLQSGQKVLIEVTVEFHELYGFNLIVHNIDPTYTMGELTLRRQEVIRQLTQDGVIDLNRELQWPMLPQRLAIVSSPSAAGYGDFMDQLHNNQYGFVFYTALFPAAMQGVSAAQSIIDALNYIIEAELDFDIVVIIRGGGATADLSCFDQYDLCYYCAQYPLPILSGIGHERDFSVLDRVAHTSVKTPTATAEHLLGNMTQQAYHLDLNADKLKATTQKLMDNYTQRLKSNSENLKSMTREQIYLAQLMIERRESTLQNSSKGFLMQKVQLVELCFANLMYRTNSRLDLLKHKMELMNKTLSSYSPDIMLQRGFSLTIHDGRIVKSVHELPVGVEICTQLHDGKIYSKINKTEIQDG